ncbi:GT2 family glycosyltransferase [Sphingomonas sp. BE138]|uniref:glycosyltransferase family 2 protein n=1 Tax=Sphingomonas sp. BE138 TaxID=2817845 RepID=UPI002854BE32|nr:glycosyltransferase [Sphingomonas sp. BE138]MDR6788467.1 GT2 family glycosyltransferase [Sphingomonas sp. BE138]
MTLPSTFPPTRIGIVAIGRNEGERLMRCLRALEGSGARVVYVDSASTDGSAARARDWGAEVVDLDMTRPFTAARARNAGLAALIGGEPGDVELVQFVDGDCELDPAWLGTATAFLDAHADVAVVCGRRRERFPEASVYNRLCDMEWDTPVGEAAACGGDALMRAAAVRAAGGFSDTLTAGEEPELCARLRAAGWRVWRIDAEMTRHDAAMLRFGQWWWRAVRGGFGYAQAGDATATLPQPLYRAEVRRAAFWAGVLPFVAVVLAMLIHPAFLLLPVAAFAAQVVRMALRGGRPRGMAWRHAFFTMLAKVPELQGVIRYRRARQATSAITYK